MKTHSERNVSRSIFCPTAKVYVLVPKRLYSKLTSKDKWQYSFLDPLIYRTYIQSVEATGSILWIFLLLFVHSKYFFMNLSNRHWGQMTFWLSDLLLKSSVFCTFGRLPERCSLFVLRSKFFEVFFIQTVGKIPCLWFSFSIIIIFFNLQYCFLLMFGTVLEHCLSSW